MIEFHVAVTSSVWAHYSWTTDKPLPPLGSPLGTLAFGDPAMRRYVGSDDFRDWRDHWGWVSVVTMQVDQQGPVRFTASEVIW